MDSLCYITHIGVQLPAYALWPVRNRCAQKGLWTWITTGEPASPRSGPRPKSFAIRRSGRRRAPSLSGCDRRRERPTPQHFRTSRGSRPVSASSSAARNIRPRHPAHHDLAAATPHVDGCVPASALSARARSTASRWRAEAGDERLRLSMMGPRLRMSGAHALRRVRLGRVRPRCVSTRREHGSFVEMSKERQRGTSLAQVPLGVAAERYGGGLVAAHPRPADGQSDFVAGRIPFTKNSHDTHPCKWFRARPRYCYR